MSVDPKISLEVVRQELADCQVDSKRYNWEISGIDEQRQIFTVKMVSSVDKQPYIIEIKFDNYKELPPLIEFINPSDGQRGVKSAYPAECKQYGGFFHSGKVCICHPSSRKSYKGYSELHGEWNISAWRQNPGVGTLTNIRAILQAIYFRISDSEIYQGRMNG